ncbi:MAG: hypothetical protein ABFR36_00645 [Acidobacteriota bacterium]
MKKEIIRIILAGSLALNLAFLGAGIFRMVNKDSSPDLKSPELISPYELRDDQRVKLDKIVKSFRVKLAGNKSEVLEKRIDIIELLGDPEFKTETLENKLLELNDIENELNYEFVSTLLEISTVMDINQWLKFLYNLSRSWFFSGSYQN